MSAFSMSAFSMSAFSMSALIIADPVSGSVLLSSTTLTRICGYLIVETTDTVRVIDDLAGTIASTVSTGAGNGDGIGFCGIGWNVAMPAAGNCSGGTIVS